MRQSRIATNLQNVMSACVNSDLSKLERGKVELERITFDVYELIAVTSETYHAMARQKGIELVSIVDCGDGLLVGDSNRLRQILCNLLSNALKVRTYSAVKRKFDPR